MQLIINSQRARTLSAVALVTLAAAMTAKNLWADQSQTKDAPLSPLKVTIDIPELYKDGHPAVPRTLLSRYKDAHFYVVITNTSTAPVYLWHEGNSNGYETLSFEVTDESGKKSVVRRKSMAWSKNIPFAQRLAPNQTCAREIHYNGATWDKLPFPASIGKKKVTLSAVFEQTPLKNASRFGLWAGKVASEPYEVVLQNED